MLSRRRFADWSWDIEEVNVAPASKRLRSDDDIKLAKDNEIWCDAQVQPSCDVKMDVDVNNHDQVLEVKEPEAVLDGQHLREQLDKCEHPVPLSSSEISQENTVQIFPQTVPLYVGNSQANDFSYCDRSAFSRHLFF